MKKRRVKAVVKMVSLFLVVAFLFQTMAIALNAAAVSNVQSRVRYSTNRIIIKYEKNADKNRIKNKVKRKRVNPFLSTKRIGKTDIEIVELQNAAQVENMLELFRQQEGVAYAVPDYKVKAYTTDTNNIRKQGIQNTDILQPFLQSIADAQKYGQIQTVRIGILDTGINVEHSAIKNHLFNNNEEIPGNGIDDDANGYIDDIHGWNFVKNNASIYSNSIIDQHGTNVAGILASAVPNAELVGLKFMENGEGYTSDAIKAIKYAETLGVSVINMSWGCEEYN